MFNRIRELLSPAEEGREGASPERIQVATCVLLLEMAHSDEEFHQMEGRIIEDVLQSRFELSPDSVQEVLSLARKERRESLDLYQFAREINDSFTIPEKEEVMESLWRIIYADGVLDKYEDYLIRKLATLLRLSHRQMIDAKLKVLDEVQRNGG